MNNGNASKLTYYTTKEVAKFYRKTVTTIRKWAREGKLPARKKGKSWLFNKKQIRADLAEMSALDFLKESAYRQPARNSFDILSGFERIDVKSSLLYRGKLGERYWQFSLSMNCQRGCAYCDYFFLVCYKDERATITRAYLIPVEKVWEIEGKKYVSSLKINSYEDKYKEFRIPYLEIPSYLRKSRENQPKIPAYELPTFTREVKETK